MARRNVQVPASFGIEASILGAILLEPRLLAVLLQEGVEPLDFDMLPNRAVYAAALEVHNEGGQCHAAAVEAALRGADELKVLRHVGGAQYLAELEADSRMPDESMLRYDVRQLKDAANKRRIRVALEQVQEMLPRAELGDVREKLAAAMKPRDAATRVVAIDEAVRNEWARPLPAALSTGLPSLDAAINGGLRAESTYFIAGPSGKGKSGLVLQLIRSFAPHRPILLLSSELTPRQVLARLVAPVARRPWMSLYEASPAEANAIADLAKSIAPRLTIHKLRRDDDVLKLALDVAEREGEAPLLVLDYLQHAARRLGGENVGALTAMMSDQITGYASDQRATALVVSSVARGFYKDHNERAATDYLGAAKHSGDVEYDAAGVFFLETETCPIGGHAVARFHIAKSRFGGEGQTIGLRFYGASGSFTEDASNALPDDQRTAFELIRNGASSVEEVRAAMSIGKQPAANLVEILSRKGLITRKPLAVVSRTP